MSNCGSTPVSLSICLDGANLHGAAAAADAASRPASARAAVRNFDAFIMRALWHSSRLPATHETIDALSTRFGPSPPLCRRPHSRQVAIAGGVRHICRHIRSGDGPARLAQREPRDAEERVL